MARWAYVVIKSNKQFSEEDIVKFINHVNAYVPEEGDKPIRYQQNIMGSLSNEDDMALRELLSQEVTSWRYFEDYIDPAELIRHLARMFRCDVEIWYVDQEYAWPERDTSRSMISADPRKIAEWWRDYKRFGKSTQPVRYHRSRMTPDNQRPHRPFEG